MVVEGVEEMEGGWTGSTESIIFVAFSYVICPMKLYGAGLSMYKWKGAQICSLELVLGRLDNLSETSAALEEKITPMASFSDKASGLIHFVIA